MALLLFPQLVLLSHLRANRRMRSAARHALRGAPAAMLDVFGAVPAASPVAVANVLQSTRVFM